MSVIKRIEPVKTEIRNIIERIEKGTAKFSVNEYECAIFTIKKATNGTHVVFGLKSITTYPICSHVVSVSDSEFTIFVHNDCPQKRDIDVDYMIF